MNQRCNSRVRIHNNGELEIVDPGFDDLPLLRLVDPAFRISKQRLPGFKSPRFARLREVRVPMTVDELAIAADEDLWIFHDDLLARLPVEDPEKFTEQTATLLDLKIELAFRILKRCTLCARRCRVDRTREETGVCGLGSRAYVAEYFVHIAEESPINPSLVLNLRGCGLRCRYCQQHRLITDVGNTEHDHELTEQLWTRLDYSKARSISFVGGNPDESLWAILKFLRSAPRTWRLPVVWNCHAYGTVETLALLNGVVDAYVPDMKYMSDECAQRWSSVPEYPSTAQAAIRSMSNQVVPVYVRILVLPGHAECCHLPALAFLAQVPVRKNLFVSVRGQYVPDWKITDQDGPLSRRPTAQEVELVENAAREFGLRVVE